MSEPVVEPVEPEESSEPVETVVEEPKAVSSVYVFNQYYWDFIKKIRDLAKQRRETHDDSRRILKVLKENYGVFDKLSEEHREWVRDHWMVSNGWVAYQTEPLETVLDFFQKDASSNIPLFKGPLTLGQLDALIQKAPMAEKYLLHQYLTLFGILCMPEVDASSLLLLMKQFKINAELKGKLEALPDESGLKVPLMRLYGVFEQITAKTSNPILDEIEQTSLGKLAKEIMSDVNMDDLGPDLLSGNLMDMFTKGGEGGLGKIISSVSQKMVSKISSGELQQEELLKDAVSVASKLPSMIPGGLGGDLSKMGDLLSMFSGGSGSRGGPEGPTAPGGFDLSSMMSMFQGMNFGGQNISKKKMKQAGTEGRVKTKLSSDMKRQRTAEKLRKKLDERRGGGPSA